MITSLITTAFLSFAPSAPSPMPCPVRDDLSISTELMTNREMYHGEEPCTPPHKNRYERRHPVLTQKERRGIRRLALQTTVPYNLR